jgi:hypothetical protein
MSSLSLGLFMLATALFLAPFARLALTDWIWGLCCGAALMVFVADPAPFSHVLGWALAGLFLCLSDRALRVDGFVKAALVGFLLGSAAKVVPLVSAEHVGLDPGLVFIGICLLAPFAGYLHLQWRGAACAVLSAALALGPLTSATGGWAVEGALTDVETSSSLSGATFLDLYFGAFT